MRALLVLAAIALPAVAAAEPASVLLDAAAGDGALLRAGLARFATHFAIAPHDEAIAALPALDALLAPARALYRDMSFADAARALEEAERQLVEGRQPGRELGRALAVVELWSGACRILASDGRGAAERFALGKRLDADARPDAIFPPEVELAFRLPSPPPSGATPIVLVPPDAALWIDGIRAAPPLAATDGLHYIVARRIGHRTLARVIRFAPRDPSHAIVLEAAPPDEILSRAAALAWGGQLTDDDVRATAIALRRALWRVERRGALFAADRFAPTVDEPALHIEHADETALTTAMCAAEPGCAPPALPAIAPVPSLVEPVTAPASVVKRRSLRSWWWLAAAVAVAVVAGVVAVSAYFATRVTTPALSCDDASFHCIDLR